MPAGTECCAEERLILLLKISHKKFQMLNNYTSLYTLNGNGKLRPGYIQQFNFFNINSLQQSICQYCSVPTVIDKSTVLL